MPVIGTRTEPCVEPLSLFVLEPILFQLVRATEGSTGRNFSGTTENVFDPLAAPVTVVVHADAARRRASEQHLARVREPRRAHQVRDGGGDAALAREAKAPDVRPGTYGIVLIKLLFEVG